MTAEIMGFLLVVFAFWGIFLWRRLRLRRAFLALYQQIAWCRHYASRDKLVLEIGSGHNPHLRADLFCDKYLCDDAHRSAPLATDRPVIVGDACALPFKTGAVDVIISRHMIEHLDDPVPFFSEAGRVAHSGLFVAPASIEERLLSRPYHRWMIEQKDGILHFHAKERPIYDPAINEFFEREVARDVQSFDRFKLDYLLRFEINYTWTDHPELVVDGKPGNIGFTDASTEEPSIQHTLKGFERVRDSIKRWARDLFHFFLSEHHRVRWTEILACPQCYEGVIVSQYDVYCPNCKLYFPVEGEIPIMLLDHARSTSFSPEGP